MKNNIDYENNVLFLSRKVRPRSLPFENKTENRMRNLPCYRKAEGACANVALLAEQMSLDTAIVVAP